MAVLKYGKLKIDDVTKVTLYNDANNMCIEYLTKDAVMNKVVVKVPKKLKIHIQASHLQSISGCGDIEVDGNVTFLSAADAIINGNLPVGGSKQRFPLFSIDTIDELPKLREVKGIRSNILYIIGNLEYLSSTNLSIPVSTKISCALTHIIQASGNVLVNGCVVTITQAYRIFLHQHRG